MEPHLHYDTYCSVTNHQTELHESQFSGEIRGSSLMIMSDEFKSARQRHPLHNRIIPQQSSVSCTRAPSPSYKFLVFNDQELLHSQISRLPVIPRELMHNSNSLLILIFPSKLSRALQNETHNPKE